MARFMWQVLLNTPIELLLATSRYLPSEIGSETLKRGNLSGPRDIPPSNPDTYRFGRFYYGRVAGVAKGSQLGALT